MSLRRFACRCICEGRASSRSPRLRRRAASLRVPALHAVVAAAILLVAPLRATSQAQDGAAAPASDVQTPWDYDPYRVMIWIAPAESGRPAVESVRSALVDRLDRDFAAVWATTIAEAPDHVQVAARRNLQGLSYDVLTAADPILAVKKNHPDASRIRTVDDVANRVGQVLTPAKYLEQVVQRDQQADRSGLDGVRAIIGTAPGSLIEAVAAWSDPSTEALLLPRAMASQLVDPEPKLISLNLDGLVVDLFRQFDKLFVVHLDDEAAGMAVRAVEVDCLMRLTGPVVESRALTPSQLPDHIGWAVSRAFAPMVRIEQAGTKSASGLLRAGGLVLDPESPAAVGTGDFLQPILRRDDRNGDPLLLQPIDWAYLEVTEAEAAKIEMRLHAGRMGGLQGQRNRRTHRMALKVRPYHPHTTIRLHAVGAPNRPLQGYEIYDKELHSTDMTFVGRTDWDGRLVIEKTDSPLRLLYVKNGGAVLARLPTVAGQTPLATADLMGDDIRLRGEAYIRGVQNAIVDLVALRQLLAARIRLRLEKGEFDEAKALLDALREQPTYETIARDMAKKQTEIQSKNPYEQRKLDEMFSTTRQMLVKHISSSLIGSLELEVAAAMKKTQAAKPAPAAE